MAEDPSAESATRAADPCSPKPWMGCQEWLGALRLRLRGNEVMIPERLITATDLVEAVLELQKLIAAEGDSERAQALHMQIASAVFEADTETLQGVIGVIDKMVEDQTIGPSPIPFEEG